MITAFELATVLGSPTTPTDEQAAVIESPLAPSVVVAGAGSGKTETMATRVVWLIANQLVAPDAVLGLTFTRKAAAELGQRIRRRLAQWRHHVERDRPDEQGHLAELMAGEPTVLTYSAYASRLTAEHAMRVGAEPSPWLLSPAVCWQLADAVVRRHPGVLPADIGALGPVVGYVLALAGQLADHLVTAAEVEEFCRATLDRCDALARGPSARAEYSGEARLFVDSTGMRLALMPLVQAYAQAKRALPAVDFGDELSLAARLAAVDEVRLIERERYRAVLLDEYQDTGHSQVAVLHGLFSGGHPVTAVGDPFQSIYGWRGASAGNIGRFTTTFPRSDGAPAKAFTLATSWRNDAVVLRAANAVAEPLRARHAGTVELRPRPGAHAGLIRAAMVETVEGEANWLAGRLRAEWDALAEVDARVPGTRTAAVLVRRRTQIPVIREALLAVGLPVEVVGLGGLLTTPEVVDVVATLRILADDRSGPALARLLTGARWRIGAADLAALNRRAMHLAHSRRRGDGDHATAGPVEQGSLVEALDDLGQPANYSAEGHRRLHTLSAELRSLRERATAPLSELVADVERTIGVDIEVAARPDRAAVGRAHLDRFLDEAARFAADADAATLPAFLAFLTAAEDEDNGLESAEVVVATERVQVLTVHGAKGLEWDIVAVPGLVDGVLPAEPKSVDWTRSRQLLPADLRGDRSDLPALDLRTPADRKELNASLVAHGNEVKRRHRDEERRLAYVAFTRARSVLLVSGYAWDNTKNARPPSDLLAAVKPHAVLDEWFTPAPDDTNPHDAEPRFAVWPVDPLGHRRRDVENAAVLVRVAMATAGAAPVDHGLLPGLLDDAAGRASGWRRDVDLLLAERARLARGGTIEVALPSQLSVSQLVALERDPHDLARRLRRPLPSRPAPLARRGTAFHAWLEQRWSAPTLLDVDDLPGAADETAQDEDLLALRTAFEASEWAARTPAEVEVPFEMAVAGTVIRGRMDAVFGDGAGWTVVDWKTGARPRGADARAAAVQLAAYRLAWASLANADLSGVAAAFHYVPTNETVRPVDLLDADGLARLIIG
ncbi:MAG: UvrD-helicase domain-containing protein [Actinomycetota bacterium]